MENKLLKQPPGRPTGSIVRNNIIGLLSREGPMHGYELYQKYIEEYPQVTMRLIYYHLKKGVSLGELKIHKIEKKKGEYSWGTEVQNIVYTVNK
jgi:DNA-binding PadR family transcriptional regulator